MKIAVLSDTHGLLRPEVLEQIESCDALIHAGDIGSQRIIDEFYTFKAKSTRLFCTWK